MNSYIACEAQLEYLVETELYELNAGDSLLFAAQLHHRWRNPGSTVNECIDRALGVFRRRATKLAPLEIC